MPVLVFFGFCLQIFCVFLSDTKMSDPRDTKIQHLERLLQKEEENGKLKTDIIDLLRENKMTNDENKMLKDENKQLKDEIKLMKLKRPRPSGFLEDDRKEKKRIIDSVMPSDDVINSFPPNPQDQQIADDNSYAISGDVIGTVVNNDEMLLNTLDFSNVGREEAEKEEIEVEEIAKDEEIDVLTNNMKKLIERTFL
jgi:hypothetical protein